MCVFFFLTFCETTTQAVVGGLAEVKQQRQLSRRPEVVVATPGRFWEMAGSHAHLSQLENLRHLVVDEADRMLERGHYPELNRLFSMLEKAEGREAEGGSGSVGGTGGRGGRFKKYKLPFDISEGGDWSVPPEEEDDDRQEEDGSSGGGGGGGPFDAMDESDDGDEEQAGPAGGQPSAATATTRGARDFARQTYVFSATLTLGASGRQQRKGGATSAGAAAAAAAKGKKGKGKARCQDEDDPVRKIMNRVGVRGDPAVIDMGRRSVGVAETGGGEEEPGPAGAAEAGGGGEAGGAGPPALPSTLKLCSIKSLQVRRGQVGEEGAWSWQAREGGLRALSGCW